ncbi:MAG: bifunctional (p)ppGpp synthetase/guanosine-3',5'-bis(diphosphate) 3'-pyrophosphohydrolase [Pseudoxanthomonas suwonensis]|nr:bifunctional (p)ppGpp synthetase/guanosine-3',5'-bis(diphosphate) 3'-pyrophosphohydrolase [Pseudoxanthomonas suwonensis]
MTPDRLDSLLALPPADACAPALADSVRAAASGLADGWLPRVPEALQADMLGSLALLGMDGETAIAALLRDAPALAEAWLPEAGKAFARVASLLEGQQAATRVWSLHAQHPRGDSEGLRRLLLAMVRDLRVVPILLARQLARMRHAAGLPETERLALARLTRDIHAPLANRLGIWQLKWELEDLAFRHLHPDTYRDIARLLDEKRSERERHIALVRRQLGQALAEHRIDGDVAGRPKHIYSIWKKMQRKGVPIGELYDLRAVRVLVDDVAACYAALGVVHALWTPIPSEFDDYIARPKRNDYRSLHTAVIGPEGKTVEVQIRTRQMHAQAELGVAAHWRYKEGKGAPGGAAIDRKIEWMRRLLEGGDGESVGAGFDNELVEDRVYVLTPKGEVLDLQQGATPLDFAYHVHTEVGHRFRGAKVDGRIVPAEYRLHTGERVEIMTGKEAAPRRDWLVQANGFLGCARSREKVRNWFNKVDRAANLQAGRELLEKELRRHGLLQADLGPVAARFNADGVDDLLVLVALGDLGPHQVARAMLELQREAAQLAAETLPGHQERGHQDLVRPGRVPRTSTGTGFVVHGIGNLLAQVAGCCHPVAGEAVAGYLTRGRGVSVHRADCTTLQRLVAREPERLLAVDWGSGAGHQDARVVLTALDRKSLLKDLTNVIAQEDAHVLEIRSDGPRRGRMLLHLRLRVADAAHLSRLLGKLEAVPAVETVRRA